MLNRYRFYREHKFLCSQLFFLDSLVAKSNFVAKEEVKKIQEHLNALEVLMNRHASFEEQAIHPLFRAKGSFLYQDIEAEHHLHQVQFNDLKTLLEDVLCATTSVCQEDLGYKFYLHYRLFVSENLKHLHAEETLLMPELQRLYTDEELRQVEFQTFRQMSSQDMAEMIAVLGPHLNPSDRDFFLQEMRAAEPEKFAQSGLDLQGELT